MGHRNIGSQQAVENTVHLDKAVARRIMAGDQAAFRSLFDRFFPRLYRFAIARLDGDHDAASDVVQQTICKGIERLDSYRGEAALYTWFCQICRNTLVDYCRARNRATKVIVPLEDLPHVRAILESVAAPVSTEPETDAWRSDIRRLVQATVDTLPEHYGEVLEWKYVEDVPVVVIAGRLGIGEKAAESLLTRARNAFREVMMDMAGTADALEPPRRN
jgi:RNA polymerase sigma-70 factor (ECF subfamily)